MKMRCPKHGVIDEPITVGFITTMLLYGPVVVPGKKYIEETNDKTPACPHCLASAIAEAVRNNVIRMKPVEK